jgi:excisionase family DNA binding protein
MNVTSTYRPRCALSVKRRPDASRSDNGGAARGGVSAAPANAFFAGGGDSTTFAAELPQPATSKTAARSGSARRTVRTVAGMGRPAHANATNLCHGDRVLEVDAKKLYSVRQVADQLGVHPETVRRLIHDGRLEAVRVGRVLRVDGRAFAGFVARQRIKP